MRLRDLIPEYAYDSSDYDAKMKAWNKEYTAFLKGKKLGGMPVMNIKVEQDGMVSFSTKVDELQLDWLISDSSTNQKKVTHIGISSPNKRGTAEFKVTGGNASAAGAWKKIEQIYNGKYSR